MTTGPYLSVQSLLLLGKQGTHGVPTAPSIVVPVDPNPSLKPNLSWGEDKGLRGSPVEIYDSIPLVRNDEYSAKGNLFCDTFPHFMMGLLGAADSVVGTVAPYTHSLKLLNSVNVGSQPPAYSILDYDLIQQGPADAAKLVNTAQIDTVSVDFTATGALTYSVKYIGNPFIETGPPVGYSISSEVFVPAYNGVLSINGSAPLTVISGSLAMKRGTAPIHVVGLQSPKRNFAGPITASGKLTFLAFKTTQAMTQGLVNQTQRLSLAFTDPTTGHTVTFLLTQVQFKTPMVDRSKPYVQVTVAFTAEANTANAVSGYSPIAFQALNAQSTAY